MGPQAEPPAVSVMIATRDRPEMLREAIAAVHDQIYAGSVETVVIFDQSEPDRSLERSDPLRPVRVVTNTRTPGLPGARNSGAAAASGTVFGFCDDDDLWLPNKLERQMAVLDAHPDLEVVVSGLEVERQGTVTRRPLERPSVTFDDLLGDRITEAAFVTALVRREAFEGGIGPADEEIPGGYGEDYEWLLRASRRSPIGVVSEPLVRIRWTGGSYFAERWRTIDEGLDYLVRRFPEFSGNARGLARILGQRAFARAAMGDRKGAFALVRRTLRRNPIEPRAYLAAAVATGVIGADRVVLALNRRGRGI